MEKKTIRIIFIIFLAPMICFGNKSDKPFEDFSTPEKCFNTVKRAISEEDVELLKKCHSTIYLDKIKEISPYSIDRIMKMKIDSMKDDMKTMSIRKLTYTSDAEEVGYNAILDVVFYRENIQKGAFIYLLKENKSWKITLPKEAFKNIDRNEVQEDLIKKEKELEDLKEN